MKMAVVSSRKRFKQILHLAYGITFFLYGFLVIDGLDFYRTPYLERPHHPEYRILRPAGVRGHGLGILGSLLMIVMLGYSLRKRVKFFRNWGPLSNWLDFHIFCGIVGPMLVILHTAFKVHGLVAVSFWSMVAVALSGVLGRYLYLKIPRNVEGEELSLKELEAMEKRINQEFREKFRLSEQQLQLLEEALRNPAAGSKGKGTVGILRMVWQDITWMFVRSRYERLIAWRLNIPQSQIRQFMEVLRRKEKLEKRIAVLVQVQQLFHYWHIIHKPFAVIMYLIMLIHVGVAVWLGYTWRF